jgi:hypothetical protein
LPAAAAEAARPFARVDADDPAVDRHAAGAQPRERRHEEVLALAPRHAAEEERDGRR